MKNLYKNVIRSFSKNKISITGLSFLVFFGVGSFCVLSNTTTNITNEYTSIASQGAMHDLTISELYNVGSPGYQTNNAGVVLTYDAITGSTWKGVDTFWGTEESDPKVATTQLTTRNSSNIDPGTYYFPIPDQIKSEEGNTYIRTYHITLDKDLSTGLYSSFADYGQESIKSIDIKISENFDSTVPTEVTTLQNAWYPNPAQPKVPVSQWSDTTMSEVTNHNIFARDYNTFMSALNEQTSIIYNAMTTSNTPVAQWLDSDESGLKDDLDYRYFKSINITGTAEGIFYKVVKSDPTDSIDKMVLFHDPNDRTGNNLFDENDYAPYGSEIVIYDKDKNPIEPGSVIEETITIPATFEEVVKQKIENIEATSWSDDLKSVYAQIMRIRFKRMAAGDNTSKDPETGFLPLFKKLAALDLSDEEYTTQLFDPTSQLHGYYQTYYQELYLGDLESISISANSNIVFSWTEPAGNPQTCTITNWTSKFAIANPQYLEHSSKRVISPTFFSSFSPFAEWYKATYKHAFSGEITQKVAINWFNSLNSDQFNFWINPFTKGDEWNQMVYDNIPDHEPITIERGKESGKWNGIDVSHILKCGGFDEIIWGCGLTPDFMYPVVDISRPTPNPKTECITYCNNIGYKTIKLGYLNAPVEEYLVCKFRANSKTSRQVAVDKINEWARSHMTYPATTRAAYLSTDTSNVLNASSFRIAYIPSLVDVIRIVTIVLSSFIAILCLLICAIIIKRYVENNRINIGIMRANGISKAKIVASMLPFALFPAIVGGIIAYLIGFFLQAPALLLFSNYWMLPTPLLGFSVWSFFGCIFLPFILFAIISSIATLVVLKTKAVDLMKSGSEFKASAFSRAIKKPFKHFGILTRFRVSLAFNSLLRLSMLAIMSTLTMSSLVFMMSTFNRLAQSQKTNSSQFEYNFNVELVTPTTSGGPYSYYDVSENQLGQANPQQFAYNTAWSTTSEQQALYDWHLTKPYQAIQLDDMQHNLIYGWDTYYDGKYDYYDIVSEYNKGLLQFPNIADATGQLTDLTYLQNRVNSRLLLDYNIGVSSITSNPWEIALALMPSNSRNIAADSYNKIIQKTGELVYAATPDDPVWWFVDPEDADHNVFKDYFIVSKDTTPVQYTLNTDMLTIGYMFSSFNPGYLNLLLRIHSNLELMQNEYPISYGMVPLNIFKGDNVKKDELYTYIKANIDSVSSGARIDKTHEIKIEGIVQNSQFIKLTDKNGNNLNDRLYGMNKQVQAHECAIVVNAYAAHKYKLKENDTITITATNTADRYERKMHEDQFKNDDSNKAVFRIVGISQGTNDEAFYVTQKDANEILGLPDGVTWNKTHKYMLWSDDLTYEWTKGSTFVWSNLPHLADLSDANEYATEETRVVYGFNSTSGLPNVRSTPAIFNRNVPVGFNGVYTQNPQGKPITSMLPLYSYSGMYPGASVFRSSGENKMTTILRFGNNLAIANLMSGLNDPKYYQECAAWVVNTDPIQPQIDAYNNVINDFLDKIVEIYGETTMIGTLCGAMDVAASDQIYKNLISTFNLAEVSIMAIIVPITIIIVGIISNLIINDSKRMAAMLKALGYSDSKNAMSILALFVPTILIGLLLSIPLSFGLLAGYQSIIFTTANILVDVTQEWWYYAVATAGIGVILVTTYVVGFISLKKDRLVDQIK